MPVRKAYEQVIQAIGLANCIAAHARLLDERERACDEEVVNQGNPPGIYAEAILKVCKLYVESPLVCV